MKSKILSVVLVLMMAFSCVAYADMSLDAPAFDYDTLKLEISGNTTNNYKEGVTLSVMPYATDRETMNDSTVNNAGSMLFDYVVSEKDGSFTYTATLNGDFVSGKYAVYADTATQTATATFMLLNSLAAASVLDRINSAANPSEVKTVIAEGCTDLGIEAAEYAKYDAYISNVIYASKPEGGYSLEDFVKQYNIAYAMAQLKNGIITMDGVVSEFGSLIDIDASEYNALSADTKAELEALIKAETGYEGDVMNYEYNFVLAQVKTAAGYEEQGGYIIDNSSLIGISLEKYDSITNNYYKNKVLQEVYNSGYTSLEAIVPAWNTAVDECYSEWQDSKGSGSSGGGGGGGGGGIGSGIGTDNGFTVTDYDKNEDLFTEVGKPQYTEDKSEPFTDAVSHWAYESIIHMYTEGIVNGYEDGTFRPNNTVTRAEFVTMLINAVDLATTSTSGVSFTDVSDSAWYAQRVKLAAANNLVQGYGGMFRPLDNISRQDAAIVIYNAIAGAGYKVEGEKSFNDTASIADYAKPYVSALAANGVINGSDGSFLPTNTLTRAEAVKLIENLLDYIDFVS